MFALTGLVALAPLMRLSGLAADAAAADKQIDAVLDRYIEAMGGRAAIEKVTTRIIKASFEGPGMPAALDWTQYAKAPNKQLAEIDIAGMGKMLDGFDGQIAWSKTPLPGCG